MQEQLCEEPWKLIRTRTLPIESGGVAVTERIAPPRQHQRSGQAADRLWRCRLPGAFLRCLPGASYSFMGWSRHPSSMESLASSGTVACSLFTRIKRHVATHICLRRNHDKALFELPLRRRWAMESWCFRCQGRRHTSCLRILA